MLTHLHIQNFLIIDNLELNFAEGFSVITGETGAGKSLIIDALTLVLGGRGSQDLIGPLQDKAYLSACFELATIPIAQEWLESNDYSSSNSECIIRRSLFKDGKSRQWINGQPCNIQQLKQFAAHFIHIHSQHQQQLLLKRDYQRTLLDSYCHQPALLQQVNSCYLAWASHDKKIKQILELQKNAAMQEELLQYQLNEFEKVAVVDNEYHQLDNEQKRLAHAKERMAFCQAAADYLTDNEKFNVEALLYQAMQQVNDALQHDSALKTAQELLQHALIHVKEAASELHAFINSTEINHDRLSTIETRLSQLHQLARKYQTRPESLLAKQDDLQTQLNALQMRTEEYQILTEQASVLKAKFYQMAEQLHHHRQQGAIQLNKKISQTIQQLGMPGGIFEVSVSATDQLAEHGIDIIDFLVATNPGQALQPLSKIASGGEISRIALAIHVATAKVKTTPILVFDEVDVGIGGNTAALIGQLLKSLGQATQVLCITHLPQVAACSQQHYRVQKEVSPSQSTAIITSLDKKQRIEEIARMLGGLTITGKTLAHAKELIDM